MIIIRKPQGFVRDRYENLSDLHVTRQNYFIYQPLQTVLGFEKYLFDLSNYVELEITININRLGIAQFIIIRI